jgi:hypothetical protein
MLCSSPLRLDLQMDNRAPRPEREKGEFRMRLSAMQNYVVFRKMLLLGVCVRGRSMTCSRVRVITSF